MAEITGKRARRVKTGRTVVVRRIARTSWLLVATNDEYEDICNEFVKKLPNEVRARIHVAKLHARLKSAKSGGSNSIVAFSKLADLTDDVVERLKASHVTKQVIFIDNLPVEAATSRLMGLQIRRSGRLHIAAKVNRALEADVINRLVVGMTGNDEGESIVDAWIEGDDLVLLSTSFERMTVPQEKLVRFLGDSNDGFERFEIDEDGRFIYWPDADVHLGWKQLEQLLDPTKAIRDQEKSDQFKVRYGKAIRALRESLGLKQSDIQGLTDRQLRRIEHGEQMASTKALKALAKAHGLEVADYLSRLAALADMAPALRTR